MRCRWEKMGSGFYRGVFQKRKKIILAFSIVIFAASKENHKELTFFSALSSLKREQFSPFFNAVAISMSQLIEVKKKLQIVHDTQLQNCLFRQLHSRRITYKNYQSITSIDSSLDVKDFSTFSIEFSEKIIKILSDNTVTKAFMVIPFQIGN